MKEDCATLTLPNIRGHSHCARNSNMKQRRIAGRSVNPFRQLHIRFRTDKKPVVSQAKTSHGQQTAQNKMKFTMSNILQRPVLYYPCQSIHGPTKPTEASPFVAVRLLRPDLTRNIHRTDLVQAQEHGLFRTRRVLHAFLEGVSTLE